MLSGSESSLSVLVMLGLGLAFGLKHATEVDHIVAVSTIVSEHRNLLRSMLVGGAWGIGHTASLIVVGAVVLGLRVAVPDSVANWLEFGVALMIIGLGAGVLVRSLRRRRDFHLHRHSHDGISHVHVHFHEGSSRHNEAVSGHSHAISLVGLKPLVVGGVHGLAGSAAVTLLVLTQIQSASLGMLYLAMFGLGSVLGMLLMSALISMPFVLTSRRLSGLHQSLQMFAAVLSIAFGVWYAYETSLGF